jgi:hypothetical protein
MCGMGGMIGSTVLDMDLEAVRNIGMVNMLRGEHSTGMFDYVPKSATKPVHYWKKAVDSLSFINTVYYNQWNTRWKDTKPQVIAYHCRHATQGKVNPENAHPFLCGNILGMHNGTIPKDFTNRKKFDTDSEALFYNINKMGLRAALDDIKDDDPAYALCWIDFQDKSVNFIRNTKRPLHYARYLGNFFWSSDKKHLEVALAANGYKTTPNVVEFEPYNLYSFKLADLDSKVDYKKELIEEAKEPVKTYGYNNYSSDVYCSYDLKKLESWGRTKKENEKYINSSFNKHDEVTGLYFTEWQYEEIQKLRAKEKPSNVIPIAPHANGIVEETDPLNDPLPFSMEDTKKLPGHQKFFVGPGFHSECTEAAYRSKLKKGCEVSGYKATIHDTVFWITNNEYISFDEAEGIVLNAKHWCRDAAYFTPEQLAQLEKDYYASLDGSLTKYGTN